MQQLSDSVTFEQRIKSEWAAQWQPGRPIYVSRAPGRLDVMGGIAEYCGSLVCSTPLGLAAHAAVQRRDDERVVIQICPWMDEGGQTPPSAASSGRVEFLLADLFENNALKPPSVVAGLFAESDRWARCPVGVLWALAEAGLVQLQSGQGFTLFLANQVPRGVGVGGSAALEVATLQALLALFALNMAPLQRAQLCQRAENLVVGKSGGIVDRITSLLGEPSALLKLRCQPHDVLGNLHLPEGVRVIGLNTGVRRAQGSEKYAKALTEARWGHLLILRKMRKDKGLRENEDPTGGFLARLSLQEYMNHYQDELPDKVMGVDFLRRFGPILNVVKRVEPAEKYRVRSRAEHHIYENQRVEEFVELLGSAGQDEKKLIAAGELMYASHWSYGQRCGLGSLETEYLVSALRQEGVQTGIYGARITGGGTGGTVAVLCRVGKQTDMAVQRAVEKYEAKYQAHVQWFTGTSPGAIAWGVKTL